MPFTADKTSAQFWVTITSVVSLALITITSMGGDLFRNAGRPSEATMLLCGGILSMASASAAWLFRNGNGSYGTEAPVVRPQNSQAPQGPP